MVRFLLDNGADVNIRVENDDTALTAASSHGHGLMIRLLLEKKYDVLVPIGLHGNALQAASVRGHEIIVRLLLDAGADVNVQSSYFDNALQAASFCGHKIIVQLLLDAGANINAQGGHNGNALQAASCRGYEKTVQLLIDEGADVKAQGGHYGNILQTALSQGYRLIVRLLLVLGRAANFNTQDEVHNDRPRRVPGFGRKMIFRLLNKNKAVADQASQVAVRTRPSQSKQTASGGAPDRNNSQGTTSVGNARPGLSNNALTSPIYKPNPPIPSTTNPLPSSNSNSAQIQPPSYFVLFSVFRRAHLHPSQIPIPASMDDDAFFAAIRAEYRRLRGFWLYYLHPRQFAYCSFTKYTRIYINRLVKHQKPELPSCPTYHYAPRPPLDDHPIDIHEWQDRFYDRTSTGGYSDALVLIPKRNQEFSLRQHDGRRDMWGLNVEFRISFLVVMAWFVVIVLGLVFGIWWYRTHNGDWQNAAVPVGTTLTTLAVLWLPLNKHFKDTV